MRAEKSKKVTVMIPGWGQSVISEEKAFNNQCCASKWCFDKYTQGLYINSLRYANLLFYFVYNIQHLLSILFMLC